MAIVERQEVQGLQSLQGGGPRATTQTIADASGLANVQARAPQQDRTANILNGLAGFADTASKASFDAAQRQVQLSKVEGTALAVKGAILPPSANKATELGYNLVQAQADLAKANDSLAQTAQQNPDMSDADFSNARKSAYDAVFAKYQDQSPELNQALVQQAQESQIALTKVRVATQLDYQKKQAGETLNFQIGNSLDSIKSGKEGGEFLDNQIMAQGKALGLSPFEIKGRVMEQMEARAATGDNRLLEAVKNTAWGKYDPETAKGQQQYENHQYTQEMRAEAARQRIEAAQAKYDAKRQSELALTYGQDLANIETAAKGGATQDQITSMLSSLKSKGFKLSPSSVASYLTMGQQYSQENIRITAAAKSNLASGMPLAFDPNINASDKPKVLDRLADEVIAQGKQYSGDEQQNFVSSNLVGLSQSSGMPVKQLQIGMDAITHLDPNSDIPASAMPFIQQLRSMDENTLRMNSSDGTFTYLSNIKDALNTAPDVRTAITRAQLLRDNKVSPNQQQQNKIKSSVNDAVKNILPLNTGSTGGLSGLFSNTGKLDKQALGLVTNQINARATNLFGVTQNIDRASAMAVDEWRHNNIVLGSGLSANVSPNNLFAKSGINVQDGSTPEMQQARAVSTLDLVVGDTLAQYNKQEKRQAKMTDTNVLFSNDGTHYQVMIDGLSVGIFKTSDLKDRFDQKHTDEWVSEQQRQLGVNKSMKALNRYASPAPIIDPSYMERNK